MKRLIPAFTLACCAWAQTATITFPTSGATISGYLPTTLTSTCNACTAVYSAEYDVDGELSMAGITRIAPYSVPFTSYNTANGVHSVAVIYRDALNSVIATSPAVSFTVANMLPQNTCPPNGSVCSSISVATGPAPTISINAANFFNGAALTLKTTGTSVVTQPVAIKSVSSAGTSLSTATFSDTAGAALVVFVQWAVSASITIADHEGNTYTCGTPNVGWSGNHINVQMCVAPNIVGGAGNFITVSYSGTENAGHDVIYTLEATKVATSSPIDVNTITTSSGGPPMLMTSAQLNPAQANELVLYGVGYGSNTTPIGGVGYTLVRDTTFGNTALEYVQISGASWVGNWAATITALGDHATSSAKFINVFVDGQNIQTTTASAATSTTLNIPTGNYLNQAHSVVITEAGPNCPGCSNGNWNFIGSWEQQPTFANPVAPIQLLASAREVNLCTTSQTNCPTTYTLTGTDLNTDGSTTAVTLATCVANSGALFTISGTCTVTQNGLEVNYLTATDSNGLTRQVWVFVNTSNVLPHFGTDGSILTAYNPALSFWFASAFQNGTPFNGYGTGVISSSLPSPAIAFGAGWANNGFNTIEQGVGGPTFSETQAAFQASLSSTVSLVTGNLASYGLGKLKYIHLIGDGYWRGVSALVTSVYGAGATYSAGSALAQALTAWQPYAVGMNGTDEVGLTWGYNPLEGTDTGGIIVGVAGGHIASLTGTGSGSCTLAWPSPWNGAFTGAQKFIVTGSGQPSLDYNTATNTPIFFGTINSSNVTFTQCTTSACSADCTFNGTINSGSTQVHPYFANAFTATGAACPSTNGGNSAACTLWTHYGDLLQMRTWQQSVTNYPKVAFALAAGTGGTAVSNWSGALSIGGHNIADYYELYVNGGSSQYLGIMQNQFAVIGSIGDQIRGNALTYMNRATPLLVESSGILGDYLFQGYPITVTSCSGNTITTATPHSIYNVIPEMTKLWVQGSTSCDGNYYVIAAPTATTITVALATPTIGGQQANGGTITFDDSNSFTLLATAGMCTNGNNVCAGAITDNGPGLFTTTATCPNNLKNERGHTFTITGSSNSNYNSGSGFVGFYDWLTLDVCTQNGVGGQSWWRQIPNLSSTGGTAYIVPDLWYRRGISWPAGEVGVRFEFADTNEIAIERASGVRSYLYTPDPQGWDRTQTGVGTASTTTSQFYLNFNVKDFLNFQAGFNPVVDYAKSHLATMANGIANIIHERITRYEFQPVLNSPDYGIWYEASARAGSYGNLLEIQYFGDAVTSCTANLAPYLVSGQPIIRISATWAGVEPIAVLNAGTTSDTIQCNPGEYRAYLFPVNEAAELNQPIISVRLADVTNASRVAVQFSYSPLAFTSASTASQVLYQTFNCSTGGVCTLPVDKNFGTIWYRLLFLDNSGALLATSDIQTL